MRTSTKNSFTSVLSINPYKETYLSGVSSFISEVSSPSFSKEQFVISYLNTREFITAHIDISKNIPDEDLYDAINNKAYDELALDQAVEYKIQYIETFNNLDENNRHFHLFIVDPLDIKNTFQNVIEKIKYIDIITPMPLLIKSLYSKEIIESNGVHCFVYFQENDASLTLYGNKEFIYTKSLKYSFLEMYERFCELYGERIQYEDFFEFFTTANLKTTESQYKEYLIRLYREIITNINDILTYAKRAFEIDKFEHIYIGTQVYTETKFYEIAEVELNIHTSEFNFDYGFETNNDGYIDQLHALMQLYTFLPSEEKYACNFTLYKRPPKFIQRESGKLIILSVASFALAFAYPVTYWVLTYTQELREDLLKQKYKEIHNIKITREATIKNKELDKEKALVLLKEEEKEYNEKKETLNKIHKVKVDYPMKAKLLALFAKELNKDDVQIDSVTYEEKDNTKTLILNLVSSKDRKITQLIEHLTKIYATKYDFDVEEILYDDKFEVYTSKLKVTLL